MQVWHSRSLFHTVAVDVLEVSPTSGNGNKVVIIGDLFTHYMMAIPFPK